MKPTLTFILPLYNGEATVTRALDSILQQSVLPEEVIIINDGSTDSSLLHVRRRMLSGRGLKKASSADAGFTEADYKTESTVSDSASPEGAYNLNLTLTANIFGCTFKLYHQENRGVAAARNLGVGLAATDYVAFIDQDDYLLPGFCKAFLRAAAGTHTKLGRKRIDLDEVLKYGSGGMRTVRLSKDGAADASAEFPDMVIGGFRRINDEGKTTRELKPSNTPWSKFMLTYPWGRIIKRSFLLDNDIKFLKTGIGEDVYFDMVAYSYTDSIVMLKNSLYVWSDNPESVSNIKYTRLNKATDPLYTFDCILRDMSEITFIPEDFEEFYFLKFTVWYLLVNARKSDYRLLIKMRDRMFAWMESNYPEYRRNPNISLRRPKGELLKNRVAVWGFMLLRKLRLDGLVLRILSFF